MADKTPQEWQPIERCTEMTLIGDERKRLLVYGEMGCAFGYVIDYLDGTRGVYADGFNGDWKITHWMPLPDPPTPEGGE